MAFETYEIGPIECGYCGNKTKFTVVAEDLSGVKTHEWEEETEWGTMDNSIERGWVHRMLVCNVCGRASFDRLFVENGYPAESEMVNGLLFSR